MGEPRYYYNEIEPYAVAWLRNLMDAGNIPAGDIDTRIIEDVRPSDLAGYNQCHFFAGIGGWPIALRLAGWGSRPVWTGSCPCQPFSVAGKGSGTEDKRHLWPAWFHLISQCRPSVVFGEQVAAAIRHEWLDGVCADLERQDYAIGSAVLPACAVNAPHRRDRIFFVADTSVPGLAKRESKSGVLQEVVGKPQGEDAPNDRGFMGDAYSFTVRQGDSIIGGRDQGSDAQSWTGSCSDDGISPWSRPAWIIGHDGKARRIEPSIRLLAHGLPARVGRLRAYGNAIVPQIAAQFIAAYAEARGLSLGSVRKAA